MKGLLLGKVILLLSAPVFLGAQAQVIDKVIATVGDELVLLSEIEEQYSLMQSNNSGEMPEGARCSILDGILTNKLLLNQARLDSVEVADEEVEAQLNARIERILSFMNNDVSQFEDYYGQSINEVKAKFQEDLKNQLLVERMRGQIISSVNVTPSEVKNFFEAIPYDSLPYFSSEVEVREIVMKPQINQEERERAIAQLTEIRERIVAGEDFGELARKYSDDGSARGGGDLGWTQRGKFVPPFEAAAYKLDPGQISEVVETQFGFHIIQLIERRGNSIHTRHILIRPEITDADLEKTRNTLDSVRHLIKDSVYTFSRALKVFGYDETQSYNNDGRMTNPATGNTFFEVSELDPDIYFTIDTMEVNEISNAFEFRDPSGEVLYRIVQLQSRTKPHRANLKQDYSKIRKAAIESKRSEFIRDWVNERIESTYIDIDALMTSKCPNTDRWLTRSVSSTLRP